MMKSKIFAIWLCTLLLSSSAIVMINSTENVSAKAVVRNGVAYNVIGPIRINSNTEFDVAHNVTAGNGTQGNPWIIENYDINGTGYGYCIYIGNTTDYFEVRNCYLHEASGNPALYFWDSGMVLYNAQNGRIANNTASSNSNYGILLETSSGNIITNNTASSNTQYGIALSYSDINTITNNTASNNTNGLYISSSNLNTITNNTASNNTNGLYISSSNSNTITNNTAFSNTGNGIWLDSCIDNTIAKNTVPNNWAGIYLWSSNGNTISNNTASNNTVGIYLQSGSSGITITHNTVSNNVNGIYLVLSSGNAIVNNTAFNNVNGIYLDTSDNNIITNNTVSMSTNNGIYLISSLSNTIYHNNFLNNTNQSYDDAVNFWNAIYPTGGNYWSNYLSPNVDMDCFVDTPYLISGGTNQDNWPFTKRNGWLNLNCTANDDNYTTDEDTILNVPVTGVLANDIDPDPTDVLRVVAVNGNPANVSSNITLPSGAILKQSANGSFAYNPNGSFEALGVGEWQVDSYIYTICDNNGSFDNATVFANVTGVNDVPTNIPLDKSNIRENLPIGSVVGNFTTADNDTGDTHTYSFAAGAGNADNNKFQLFGDQLRSGEIFNYETQSSCSIRIQTNDGNGGIYQKVFIINILDLNDAPTDITLSNANIGENQPVGTNVGSFTTIDEDAGDTFIYSFVSGAGDTDNAQFQISGNQLQSNAIYNFEVKSSYSIRVLTTDAGGLNLSKAFSISITNVNEAPTNVILSNANIQENQPIGTAVGTFTTTDPDLGDTFTYSFVSGAGDTDNAQFQIAGNQLLSNAIYDYEVQNSYSIRVLTTDAGGLNFSKAFTITILNANDAPADITISNANIDENQPIGTAVGTFSSTDPDLGDTFIYSFAVGAGDTDNAQFQISGNQLQSNAIYNYEVKNSYSIRVLTTDAGGLNFSKAFTITIIDINDAPVAYDDTYSTGEHSTLNGGAPGVIGNDQDEDGDMLILTHVNGITTNVGVQITLPSGALLTLNVDGSFSYNPNGQFENLTSITTATDSFTYTINDGSASDSATVTITITGVNDAPVLGAIGNKNVNELAALTFTAIATDVDAGTTLTYSLDAGAPPGASINPVTGAFAWIPTEIQGPGTYFVTIRVTDNGSPALNDSEPIQITVGEVNVAPILNAIGNRIVDEETGLVFTATATDADLPANTLTFSLDASFPAGASITAGGMFYWTPTEAQGPGSYPVTINVTDGLAWDKETITITVNDVNVAPVAANDAATINEDGGASAINVLANDIDQDLPANTLTIIAIAQGTHGTVTITGGGTGLTYTPAADYFGTDSFTYTINDGNGGNDTAIVTITVLNINDNPTAVDDTITIPEDCGPRTILVLANDLIAPDVSEILNITAVTQGTHGAVTITNSGTRVTYEPDKNYYGTDTFTYTISDGNGGIDTAIVTVLVTNVNDEPVITTADLTSAIAGEDYIVDYAATDIDGDALTWSMVTSADWLHINPATGLINGTAKVGNFNVLIVVNDGNGGASHHSFTLTVTEKDSDSDGVPDSIDAFPNNANETIDTDSDGIGNNADTDDDGDGVPDTEDAFPLNPAETTDTDGDGIGNNADLDDDGDGVLDVNDPEPLNPAVTGNEYQPGWPYWYVLLIIGIAAIIGLVGLALVWVAVRKN
jgi:parallel beta-helix repeat protein/VCBS repeat-containing protein